MTSMSKRGPVLLLETAAGELHQATAADIVSALGTARPPLVVLSACRTAEVGRAGAVAHAGRRDVATGEALRDATRRPADAGAEVTASFARQLTTQVANVVGWDGSVYDQDAIDFAQTFYRELGRGASVPRAAAVAQADPTARCTGRTGSVADTGTWHGSISDRGAAGLWRRHASCGGRHRASCWSRHSSTRDDSVFRWQRALSSSGDGGRSSRCCGRSDDGRGVLVHGMGALGKSSLAARVASRTPRRPVVIFERYDALAIFDKVAGGVDSRQRRLRERKTWREQVKSDRRPPRRGPGELAGRTARHRSDPADRRRPGAHSGDAPAGQCRGGQWRLRPEYRVPLGAMLRAFARVQTSSRLLLTSRYDIRHPDGAGGDLAGDLVRVPLTPMRPRERIKQLRAAERLPDRRGCGRRHRTD